MVWEPLGAHCRTQEPPPGTNPIPAVGLCCFCSQRVGEQHGPGQLLSGCVSSCFSSTFVSHSPSQITAGAIIATVAAETGTPGPELMCPTAASSPPRVVLCFEPLWGHAQLLELWDFPPGDFSGFHRDRGFSSFARAALNVPSALCSAMSPCTSTGKRARDALGPPPQETLAANSFIILQ